MGADPARGLVAGRPDERGDDRGGRQRSVAGVGQDPLPAAALEHDPDPLETGFAGEPFDDRAGDRLGAVGGRQQSADREQAGRLDRPPVRLGGTLPTECREAADGERDDEDQDEVEQLARVGDREREARLGEQQVVDEERGDGRDDRRHGPAERPDDDHRHEVDRRGVGDLGHLFEDGDDRACRAAIMTTATRATRERSKRVAAAFGWPGSATIREHRRDGTSGACEPIAVCRRIAIESRSGLTRRTTGWYLALYQSTARRDPTLTHTLRCTAGRTLPLSTTGNRTVEITCRARL